VTPKPLPPARPAADFTEAVQRIVPRRHLVVQDGDVLISRAASGFGSPGRLVYIIAVQGSGPTTDRFANFEHAAARGEELAKNRQVRLFYCESKDEVPMLLKDARA
jgi:hypothetical protein